MSESWEKLRARAAGKTGRTYWRSLEELADTAEFREAVEREFPPQASELLDSSRRGFLKVMGASVALAGLASCRRWPQEQVLPYARRQPGRSEGVPVHYTTAFEIGGMAQGILATSYDGRPIKIEGNPQHPLNKGTTDQFAQATVLQVYDPDRSRGVMMRSGSEFVSKSWEDFSQYAKTIVAGDGAGVYVLSESSSSPSIAAMRTQLQQTYPQLKWAEYEAISGDNRREGARIAFGAPQRVVYELSKAKTIVAIDADIFCSGDPLTIKYARDFAAGRRIEDEKAQGMNRLWVVESGYSNTGAAADHRRGAKPSQIQNFILELAAAVGVPGVSAAKSGIDAAFIAKLADELKSSRGAAAIIAGDHLSPELHAAVLAMNDYIGATGNTVLLYADADPQRPHHLEAIKSLAADMGAGKVSTLIMIGGNPAYDAPADLDFAGKLGKVKNAIHFGMYEDETSRFCAWHVSQAHYLEGWGDARTYDGTISIVQPLIEPLFDGKTTIEFLSLLAGKPQSGYDIVRKTLGVTPLSEWKWKKALYDGVVEGTATQLPRLSVDRDFYGMMQRATAGLKPVPQGAYEIVLRSDSKVYDGRFANLGWMQELPDPITRIAWDNVAAMSLVTAEKLHVGNGDLIAVDAGGQKLQIAAWVVPGIPENVISISLGYGRSAAGSIGNGVGFNSYQLRTSQNMAVLAGNVSATGGKYPLASVQQHHLIDEVGRKAVQARVPELVRERTFEEYKHDPSLGYKKVVSLSVFDEHDYKDHKWGMAIDLTTCIGCSACVVACQSENNIPIVGKEQVMHGREMHWIRIDRYFRETPEEPVSVNQPVMCMHCEMAPCEEVCPVGATTHSKEGLNMMTYNRCIGTRYCSNNCPYKVRRFNFFDYNNGSIKDLYTPNLLRPELNELRKMQKNPQVTVRSRGVMEKCTYCVQRIENKRIEAWNEGRRPIADGEIQTACQQSCPTQAIAFGDLNDPNSRVKKLHDLATSYGVLDAELNTKPRTQYRVKIRNPVEGLDAELFENENAER